MSGHVEGRCTRWVRAAYLDHVTALVHELSEVANRSTAAVHSCASLGQCAPALRTPAAALCYLAHQLVLSASVHTTTRMLKAECVCAQCRLCQRVVNGKYAAQQWVTRAYARDEGGTYADRLGLVYVQEQHTLLSKLSSVL